MGTADTSILNVAVKSSGISETSSQLSGLGTSAKNAETKVVSLTASIDKLMNVQRTATGAAMAYAQSLQGAQQYLGGNQASTLGLETATAMLAKSMAALSASLQTVKEKSNQSRTAIVEHTAAMQDAHAMARGLSGGLGALWLTYGNIVPMVAGVAMAKGFMDAAKSGSEFAYQLKFVQGLGEETAATMDKVSVSILNMSKGSMFSPVEMASGMRILSQAGLDAADALKVLPSAMDLAVVGEMSMEKASITLVGVMNAFKLTVADVPHIGDVFAKAAAVSQTSVEQMTEAMKSASVVGEMYGVSMEDAATAVTLLAKVNITGSAAGTSLKNMFKEMYAPGKQAADLMKDIGMQAANADGSLRPMADVIFDLQGKLEQFDKISQTQILQRLFGERGAKEAIAMLSITRDKWDELQSSIANSDGFMRKVSSMLEDTVKGKWLQAVDTFKEKLQEAYESMAPILEKMAESFKTMFADESFISALKQMVVGMASLVGFLATNATLILKLAEAFLVYKAATIAASVATEVFLGIAKLVAIFSGVSAAVGTATAALPLFGSTLVAVAAGTATTITGMTGIAGAATLLAGPIGVIAALLVAGVGLWLMYEDAGAKALKEIKDDADKTKGSIEGINSAINDISLGKVSGDIGIQGALKGYADLNKEVETFENKVSKHFGGRPLTFDTEHRVKDQGSTAAWNFSYKGDAAELEQARLVLIEKRTKLDELAATAAEKRASGEETLNQALKTGNVHYTKADKGAISDQYAADLAEIQGQIDSVNRALKTSLADLDSSYKQGLIGDIALIDARREASVKAHQEDIKLLQDKLRLSAPDKKESVRQEIENDKKRYLDKTIEDEAEATREIAELYAGMEEKKKQASIAGLKASGQYVEAFLAEQSVMYDAELSRNNSNLASNAKHLQEQLDIISNPDSKPLAIEAATKEAEKLEQRLQQGVEYFKFISKQKAEGFQAAQFKETDMAVQATIRSIQEGVAELQSQTVDGSLIGKLFASNALDDLYQNKLPALRKELDLEAEQAKQGTDEQRKAYATRKIDYDKMIKHQRDVYKDFISEVDKLGSEGFQALFSNTEGSWKSYVKKMKDSFKTYLVDEIYKMFVRPFVLQIIANLAGITGMSGLQSALNGAAGSGGGYGNLFSTGRSLWDAASMVSSGSGALPGTATLANTFPSTATLGDGSVVPDNLGRFIDLNPHWTGTGLSESSTYAENMANLNAQAETELTALTDSATAATTGLESLGQTAVTSAEEWSSFSAGTSAMEAGGATLSTTVAGETASVVSSAAAVEGGSTLALSGATAAGEGAGLMASASTMGPYVMAAVALYLALSGDDGPVERHGKYDRKFGSTDSLTDNPDGGVKYPWKDNFRFSSDMSASQDKFNTDLITQEKGLISSLHLTDDQVSAINKELEKSATSVYDFGMEKTDWLSSSADEMIASSRVKAIATALGKPISEIVAALDPLFSTLVGAGKKIGVGADALLDMAGTPEHMKTLTDQINGYYNEFYSVAEKNARIMLPVTEAFRSVNMEVPTTRDGFKSIIEGLDLTTTEGQHTFEVLMGVSGAFSSVIPAVEGTTTALKELSQMDGFSNFVSKFYTAQEQTAMHGAHLLSSFTAIGVAMPKTNADFRQLIETLAAGTPEQKKQAETLMGLTDEYFNYNKALTDTATAVANAADVISNAGEALGDIQAGGATAADNFMAKLAELTKGMNYQDTLSLQLSEANKKKDYFTSRLGFESDGYGGGTLDGKYYKPFELDAIQAQFTNIVGSLSTDMTRFVGYSAQYNSSIAEQLVALDKWKEDQSATLFYTPELMARLEESYNRQFEAIVAGVTSTSNAVADALSKLLHSTLDTMVGTILPSLKREQAKAQIEAALAIARAGGPLPTADSLRDALSTVTKLSSDGFSSKQDMDREYLRTMGSISTLASLVDGRTIAEQQLSVQTDMLAQLQIISGTTTLVQNNTQSVPFVRTVTSSGSGTTVPSEDLKELIAEIVGFREEQKQFGIADAARNIKVTRIIDKWDALGVEI